MNVVDSSAWLEYLASGPNADYFAPAIEETDKLVVPTISLYEVFKKTFRVFGQERALQVAALMQQGELVPLDSGLALLAALTSVENDLPMADAIMLATARSRHAVLWTQDADFQGIEGVRYRPRG